MKKRILFLMSDTGGGHRSAAEALCEALLTEYPGQCQIQILDGLLKYMPYPINRATRLYPVMVAPRAVRGWEIGYRLTDRPRTVRRLNRMVWPVVRSRMLRLIQENPADIIVGVHPLFSHATCWALKRMHSSVPFMVVVTDLLTGHAAWYSPEVDRMTVPTDGAREFALNYGVPREKVVVRGLPVAAKFAGGVGDKNELRARLQLPCQGPIVMVVGGGEGMGPVYDIAEAISEVRVPLSCLVIIAGRNTSLRERLRITHWKIPVRVEGFVTNMPDWMGAADILVTKAGPGTIAEALIAGLPMILSGKIPGQEDGNVDYVVEQRVGVWAPEPDRIAQVLIDWIRPGNSEIAEMSARAQRLGKPGAASAIAADIMYLLEFGRPPR